MKDITEFQEKVGITFNDPALLTRAFTHRSYLNENKAPGLKHNERLEFLGDAVLELAVTRFLFDGYPNKPEGDLTAVRAALVNTVSIAEAADELNMGDYLRLSKGEARDKGRARQYILANTFESVIGAIYLDQGYDVARDFIADALFHKAKKIVEENLWRDAKSYFQEQAQEHQSITPTYEVISEEGPDHDKTFTVGVYLNQIPVAKGKGQSKQEAEQAAAEKALEIKGWS